jgi:UDP-glucose 4-epimerase
MVHTTSSVVAVTGGAGFIGSATVTALRRSGHRVIAIDRAASRGESPSLDIDILDLPAMSEALERHHVEVVVHGAAIVGVPQVRQDLIAATTVNIVGAVTVLTAAAAAGVRRVLDLSSEEVYGSGGSDSSLREDRELRPMSAYGVHKATVESLAAEFTEQLEYAAARLSWIFGAGFPRRRPPQSWLDDAAAGRSSPPAGGADHVADLLHIDDAVGAIVSLAETSHLHHNAYNIGSGRATRLGDVADLIRALRPGWKFEHRPGPLDGVVPRPPLDVSRISEETGWTPDLSLEEGLRRTLHGR